MNLHNIAVSGRLLLTRAPRNLTNRPPSYPPDRPARLRGLIENHTLRQYLMAAAKTLAHRHHGRRAGLDAAKIAAIASYTMAHGYRKRCGDAFPAIPCSAAGSRCSSPPASLFAAPGNTREMSDPNR